MLIRSVVEVVMAALPMVEDTDEGESEGESLAPPTNWTRRKLLKMSGPAVLTAGAGALTGCSGDSDIGSPESGETLGDTETASGADITPTTGGTLTVIISRNWNTLFSFKHVSKAPALILSNVSEFWTTWDSEAGEMQPGAIEEWEWTDDTTMRCTIREGMRFHGGYGEVTAEDFVYISNRVINEGFGGGFIPKFLWTDRVEEAVQVDKYTFDINLNEVYSPFPASVLMNSRVVSKEAIEEMGDDEYAKTPIGNGPYQITENSPGDRVVMEKFEDHPGNSSGHRGPGYVDEIVFRLATEASTKVNLFENGEADLIESVPFRKISDLNEFEDGRVVENPGWNFDWLEIGGQKGDQPQRDILDKVKVRKALNYATPRASLVENAYDGFAGIEDDHLTVSRLAEALPDGRPEVFPDEADLEEAQSLLDEAGHGDGFEIELSYKNLSRFNRMAQIIQATWENLGLDVTLNQLDAPTFANVEREGTYDVALSDLGWLAPDYEQGVNYFHGVTGDLNSMGYNNDQVNEWIEEQRTMFDLEDRAEINQKIFDTVIPESPWIFLNNLKFYRAERNRLKRSSALYPVRDRNLDLTDAWIQE
jgi:peptide/nickel transport system substrate-binding protein